MRDERGSGSPARTSGEQQAGISTRLPWVTAAEEETGRAAVGQDGLSGEGRANKLALGRMRAPRCACRCGKRGDRASADSSTDLSRPTMRSATRSRSCGRSGAATLGGKTCTQGTGYSEETMPRQKSRNNERDLRYGDIVAVSS
ncbi:hypothetical protein ERJ75_000517200 [Trypanosoma vivax]|nr:hypothetical protein ERJ75_000517200 [Trypanosoma vivax]